MGGYRVRLKGTGIFLPGGTPRASHAGVCMLMVRHTLTARGIGSWGVTACNPYLGLVRVLVNPHRYGLTCLRRNTSVALDLPTSSSVASEQ